MKSFDDMSTADLAHVDMRRVERAIYRRRPRFQSVEEFAAFCRYAADRWESPGVTSVSGAAIELEQLGVKVDTSLPPVSAYEPTVVDHLATVRAVLLDAADRLPDFKLWRWGQHEIQGIPQTHLADDEGVSTSTMSDWVIECRDVLAAVLARRGMMDRAHLDDGGEQ